MPNHTLIVLPWQPWSKKRPRVSRGGHRTHQDPADKKAEEHTREHLRNEWTGPPIATNVSLVVRFYRQTRQIVDCDNLVKHLLDSANGVLWVDDAQVTRLQAELYLDRENPRTELFVGPHQTSMVRDYSHKLE